VDQIFIQVASYCDRLLIRTVNVALKRAKHPKRLRFGICIQDNPKRFKKLLNELPKTSSILLWNCDKSQGVGWARSQAQSLLKNEQYTLQIDAHMDFALNWDYLLIKMWEKCNNEKAIFSQLCHGWQGIPKKELILQEPRTCGIKTQWYKDCFGVGWGISAAGKAPVRQAFTCAHMVFAPSNFFNQVPIDPKIG
jgi:hypothetical protein